MTTLTENVSTAGQLNDAIEEADSLGGGSTAAITLTGNIALNGTKLEGIYLEAGFTLDINGGGYTLDGGGTQRGLFVYAGAVDISDLTILDAKALGGNGSLGGGGGAGLGGGLLIGANVAGDPGTVTLTGVTFSGDAATGGSGGAGTYGAGGGLGGNAGTGQSGGGGGIAGMAAPAAVPA